MVKNMLDTKEISKFLTPELCEDAGIIIINIGEETLDLGAMNLDYIKVKKVIQTIKSKFNLEVSLKQITSLEWETWFENTHAVSVETIQKGTIDNQNKEKIIEFEEESLNEGVKTFTKESNLENNNFSLQKI